MPGHASGKWGREEPGGMVTGVRKRHGTTPWTILPDHTPLIRAVTLFSKTNLRCPHVSPFSSGGVKKNFRCPSSLLPCLEPVAFLGPPFLDLWAGGPPHGVPLGRNGTEPVASRTRPAFSGNH